MESNIEITQFRDIKMASAPSKEICELEHGRMVEFLTKDFVANLMKQKELGNKSWIQAHFQAMCNALSIHPDTARYLLLGVNPMKKMWGELNKNTELTPVKYVLRKKVCEMGYTALPGYGFKVYFGDRHRNGNFDMSVDFYKHKTPYKGTADDTASADSKDKATETTKSKDKKSDWVKVVKRPSPATVTIPKTEFEALKQRLEALEKQVKPE